eukprot:CAMPEP_0117654922 /NCGR_PEP_ID=MMETSP0804-20121206/4005_1 /TAXON_ID=1074897 /ORGANISM="Tetraselmis astigmatica, Strain CCMP880" /LENGTH=335 /DNA_ID=CAMNT_0005461241 /DNA_START=138 /DNA_END=1145 /DNA_ORIENTATION=+
MAQPPLTYFQPDRPWLQIYNTRLPKPRAKRKSFSVERPLDQRDVSESPSNGDGEEEIPELSPIQQLLDDDILAQVFQFMPTYVVAHAACVCKQWSRVASTPALWESACMRAFCDTSPEENRRLLRDSFRGSWQAMFYNRPHVRLDGVYISRNTYIRVGEQGFRVKNPVHLVLYFRYLRFLPGGDLIYRTTPSIPSAVAQSMRYYEKHVNKPAHSRDGVNIMKGRFKLNSSGKLYTSILYPGSKSTEVRCRMSLRSLHKGANNRIDIHELITYDRELGRALPQPSSLGSETSDDENIPNRNVHNRGLNTYVFVPWEWMNSTVLNLSLEEMDYFVPG